MDFVYVVMTHDYLYHCVCIVIGSTLTKVILYEFNSIEMLLVVEIIN